MTTMTWNRLPVNERAAILASRSVDALDNYVRVSRRLRKRFTRSGYVTVEIGEKPAPYRILEDMAWMKYVVNGR